MGFAGEFDVIFSSSALQWFEDPANALAICAQALRPGGRMGVQAPATSSDCPQMVEAVRQVAASPRTMNTFICFENPWFFLERTQAYMRLLESGAAAGYLNPAFYPVGFGEDYAEAFREIVMGHYAKLAETGRGRMELEFKRLYLVADKPAAGKRPSPGRTS